MYSSYYKKLYIQVWRKSDKKITASMQKHYIQNIYICMYTYYKVLENNRKHFKGIRITLLLGLSFTLQDSLISSGNLLINGLGIHCWNINVLNWKLSLISVYYANKLQMCVKHLTRKQKLKLTIKFSMMNAGILKKIHNFIHKIIFILHLRTKMSVIIKNSNTL